MMPKRKARKPPVDGVCCSCGYKGQEEIKCQKREDESHCVHWWDGPTQPEAR